MGKEAYHKYVFDADKRNFLGKFEQMYQKEDFEDFDSWHQEDLRHLIRQISLAVLNRYNFSKILDLGCGKGVFTQMLKKENNCVIGIDLSETAIKKARIKYPDIKFEVGLLEEFKFDGEFDLVVAMETLSYLKNWKRLIENLAKATKYFCISLYLPLSPIGFVKTRDELKQEVSKFFKLETSIIIEQSNGEIVLLLGKRIAK